MTALTKTLLLPIVATSFLLTCVATTAGAQQDTTTVAIDSAAMKPVYFVVGTVTSAYDKKGILGIQVEVANFSGAVTDEDGNFEIKVPSLDATLLFSSEGFQSREIPLLSRDTITVVMNDASLKALSDPIITPTGTIPQNRVVTSLSEYEPNGALSQPFDVTDAALQGRVAGLNVIRRSGMPGIGANMFLRGFTSLYATNKPLIVVDGMIYDTEDYGKSLIANNYTNPLSLIDPKDIENITVLKDASSIYGTKGANGAILITTVKAKEQATKIDFNLFSQSNFAPDHLPVMEAYDYRIYLSDMLQSKGYTSDQIAALPYMNDDPNSPTYAANHYETDWQDKVLKSSNSQNLFFKVTGGDNIATYGLTLGANRDNGVMNNTNMLRYNTRFNAEFNFTQKLKGTTNLSFSYAEQNLKDQGISSATSPLYLSLVKAPFLPEYEIDPSGNESPNYANVDTFGLSNPSVLAHTAQFYNKYYRFFGSFGLNYEISKDLTASTLIGITHDKVRENIFIPRYGVSDDTLFNALGDSRLGTSVKRLFTLYNDTRIAYKKEFAGEHKFSTALGFRFQNNRVEQDYALGYNSAVDELVNIQNGVAALRTVGGNTGEWAWMNTYFNVGYGFRDKYFATFNMAMDGSSRFGDSGTAGIGISGNRFALMPSIGAAWLISSERFMRNSGINLLKLRATYSQTGNDDIGNYAAQQTYVSQNLLGMQGLVRSGIPNTSLQWESVRRLNAGVDVSTFNERVSLSADVYNNTTTNMLVYQPMASVTGFEAVLTNDGSMETVGVDIALNARVVNHRDFKWDIGVNISSYKNKILEVPNGDFTTDFSGATYLTARGGAANQFYGYKTEGIFATSEEAAAAGLMTRNEDGTLSNFGAGDVHFVDLNGDKIIDDKDRQVIGNPNPDYTGGISTQLSWKGFTLAALFTFSKGNDVYNLIRNKLEAVDALDNQLTAVNARWKEEGQVTDIPKATYGDPLGNNRFSDRWIEDGSYFRLRSVSLNYQIPIKAGMVIRSAGVYVNATNLITWSKYLGYDPEFSAGSSIFRQGVDLGLSPLYRSVMFGVRVGF